MSNRVELPNTPMTLDTHAAGTRLAKDLRERIVWLSPFDTIGSFKDIGVVSIVIQSGPLNIAAGTVMLTGKFRKEAGEGAMASVEVEHKDQVVVFAVQQPDLQPTEESEFARIVSTAVKALGGKEAHFEKVDLGRPGKGFRYTWAYSRLDNPMGL